MYEKADIHLRKILAEWERGGIDECVCGMLILKNRSDYSDFTRQLHGLGIHASRIVSLVYLFENWPVSKLAELLKLNLPYLVCVETSRRHQVK